MPQKVAVRAGITIVELVVVMMVVGIVLSIGMPRIDLTRVRMDSGFRQLGIKLLAAQRMAIMRQHSVVIAFDTVGGRIRLHEDRNNDGAVQSTEPITFVALEEGLVFGRGMAAAMPMGGGPITFVKRQDRDAGCDFHAQRQCRRDGWFLRDFGPGQGDRALCQRCAGISGSARNRPGFPIPIRRRFLAEEVLMSRREGFTLVEVVVALLLLSVSVLGIQIVAASMLRRMATGNIQQTAIQLAEDRIDRVRLEPNYAVLDSFARTESTLTGFPNYTRITTVTRFVDTTAAGTDTMRITDFRRFTVEVRRQALPAPVFRTLVIGAP